MSVAALRPSGWNALPSMNSSASNLPGPHDARTFLTVARSTPSRSVTGLRFGAAEMIAPTLRSRFGQPSRRWPTPGATELLTVEWQTAQVSPIEVIRPEREKCPLTPTTALSLMSARVVAGESRFTLPAFSALSTDPGSALASTFRPSDRAVFGLTPGPTPPCERPSIALSSCSAPLQNALSPKSSKRKICRPCVTSAAALPSAVDEPDVDEDRRGWDETELTLNSAPPASAQAPISPPVRSTFRRRLDRSICWLLPRHDFRHSTLCLNGT